MYCCKGAMDTCSDKMDFALPLQSILYIGRSLNGDGSSVSF